MRIVSVAILLMIGVLLLTVNVNAGTKIEEAKVACGKGRDLFEQGNYVEAAGSFRKAYELKPNWKILYNIGQCEASAKRHGLALTAFEEYFSRGGDDIPPERKDEVLAEISRLKLIVGMLEIFAPDGAEIAIDNVIRGTAPLSSGPAHHVPVIRWAVLSTPLFKLPRRPFYLEIYLFYSPIAERTGS